MVAFCFVAAALLKSLSCLAVGPQTRHKHTRCCARQRKHLRIFLFSSVTELGDNLGCFQPNRVNRVTEPRCFARSKVHRTEYNRDNKLITYSVEPERVSVHQSVSYTQDSADCWPLGRLLLLAIRTTYNQLTTCIEHCTTPLPDKGTLQDHVP